MRIKLGDIITNEIAKKRSLAQGYLAAPFIFNNALDGPIRKLNALAQKREWGIKVQDSEGDTIFICILLFADNYWLISTSPEESRNILTAWL